MTAYLLAIFALLFSFLALVSCLRFIFSRQFLYWILPSVISLVLSFQNLNTILILGTADETPSYVGFNEIIPLVLVILWYAMIVVFFFALRMAIPENKYLNDSKKNRAEALYLGKLEERKSMKLKREREETIANRTQVPEVRQYHGPDIG